MELWKEKVCSYLDEIKESLFGISRDIFNHPEISFEEYYASKLLAKELEQAGFEVDLGVANLETAIRAVHPAKAAGPTVAILGEYDALPEVGHGCGHNLIATASLGATLALGTIKKELPGKLVFLGTPAEEGGGGKIIMIEAGLFDDLDVAMMFHPSATYTMVGRGGLAMSEITMEFFGQTAHASADPENGINALDAVIQTFNSISALRQHIKSSARIHGIITHGGEKPNIVPDYAAASFYVRALDNEYRDELIQKVENCAKGATIATGAVLNFEIVGPSYAARNVNRTLGEAFVENLKTLNVPLKPMPEGSGLGSSDIGNVSQVVPAIHPYLSISEESIPGHSKEFAKAAISERGHQAMLNAAKALAMTAIDIFTKPELLEKIQVEFQERVQKKN
ncbi:MAG: amidohydrolase [Candidatus Heimdallarchaeota archaeon]|nr:amidohydrolase [Candidatus Heimdallarchaeota archaeon]